MALVFVLVISVDMFVIWREYWSAGLGLQQLFDLET